jgi:hypothetical protein
MTTCKGTLDIRIGSNIETLRVTKTNDDNGVYINSKDWEGIIIVRVADSRNPKQNGFYFHGKYRTFSIQFRNGCWKKRWPAEDILFGVEFEKPINPPVGTSLAFKCARLIDPSLETNLYSTYPWILSPLICAFNDLSIVTGKEDYKDDNIFIVEENSLLFGKQITKSSRRNLLKSKEELGKCEISPDLIYSGDFYGPALDLVNMELNLGIHINIQKYVNGQPIRFLARSKSTETIFFVIEFSSRKISD